MTQDGGRYHTVFPNISKANHCCDPNCWVVVPESAPGEVVSVRSIAAEDELTVSYLCRSDLLRSVRGRQKMLKSGWEFTCCCRRCASDVDDSRRFSCSRCVEARGTNTTSTSSSITPTGEGESLLAAVKSCCFALNAPGEDDASADGGCDLKVTACAACGARPSSSELTEWRQREIEVEDLLEALPEGLYAAWATCEDFAKDHPFHGLSGRWKNFIARRTLSEAAEAETEEEKWALQQEAEEHRQALQLCMAEVLHEDFTDAAADQNLDDVPALPLPGKLPPLQPQRASSSSSSS